MPKSEKKELAKLQKIIDELAAKGIGFSTKLTESKYAEVPHSDELFEHFEQERFGAQLQPFAKAKGKIKRKILLGKKLNTGESLGFKKSNEYFLMNKIKKEKVLRGLPKSIEDLDKVYGKIGKGLRKPSTIELLAEKRKFRESMLKNKIIPISKVKVQKIPSELRKAYTSIPGRQNRPLRVLAKKEQMIKAGKTKFGKFGKYLKGLGKLTPMLMLLDIPQMKKQSDIMKIHRRETGKPFMTEDPEKWLEKYKAEMHKRGKLG